MRKHKILNEYCTRVEKVIRSERKVLSRKSLVPTQSPGKKGKRHDNNKVKMNPANLEV